MHFNLFYYDFHTHLFNLILTLQAFTLNIKNIFLFPDSKENFLVYSIQK
jgi:hypothetical protein